MKPSDSPEVSAEKAMCMLPDVAVTALGMVLPLNDPRLGASLLVPSNTLTKS